MKRRSKRCASASLVGFLTMKAVKKLDRMNSKSLACDYTTTRNDICDNWWRGIAPRPLKAYSQGVDVVLSYCQGDPSNHIAEVAASQRVERVFIYSKCSKLNASNIPAGAVFRTLQNKGRCDHTYAHHILTQICQRSGEQHKSKVILFLKDTNKIHQQAKRNSMEDMIRTAADDQGFACGLIPLVTNGKFGYKDLSYWHSVNEMREFKMSHYNKGVYEDSSKYFRSSYSNLGEWLDVIGTTFHTDPIPVCYGGVFAVKYKQFTDEVCRVLGAAIHGLERADNIEEGHYMERLWAALLTDTGVAQRVSLMIPARATGFIKKETFGYLGTYYGCTVQNRERS